MAQAIQEPAIDGIEALEGLEGTDLVDALIEHVDNMQTHRPEEQLRILERVLGLAQSIGYDRGVASATGIRGRVNFLLSRHQEAIPDLQYAIAFFDEQADRASGALHRGVLAALLSSQGSYEEAVTLALENLDAARESDDRVGVGWVLLGLSGAFLELGQPDEALSNAMEALETLGAIGHLTGQARAHSAIGTALRTMDRLEEARGHHEVSLQLFQEDGDRLGESRAYHDLGLIEFAREEFPRALELHQKALALRKEVKSAQAECTTLIELGRTYRRLGEPAKSLEALTRACKIAEELSLRPKLFATHLTLAEVHEFMGDSALALHHFRLFHNIHDEVLGSRATGRIQSMQARFEAERAQQETEIARLRNVELRQKNEQLEKLLDELKKTQGRLVQSEKLASLGRVTSGIAHEIKNPLNFVINFADLNAELLTDMEGVLAERGQELPADVLSLLTDDIETMAENITRVLENARRADGIVKSMLGHVRHTGGSHRPTDLSALLRESVGAAFGGASGDNGLAISWDLDARIGSVELTPHSMQRVFVNVLDNARYSVLGRASMEENGFQPSIEIKTKRLPGMVQVRITDNGLGIPAENCTRIFEPFYTTRPTGEGTGLGLSLAYDIVTQGHDGSMAAISKEGEGATLVVTLPEAAG